MDGNSRLKNRVRARPATPGNAQPRWQEIKRRMRTRFPWIVATLALVAIGFLIACSTKYSANSSTHALVVVPTQGTIEVPQATAVMETFSVNLANGSASQINNVNGP